MREKLFKENYKLLVKIANELITKEEVNFYLSHRPEWIAEIFCKYGASIERVDEKHIYATTFYYMDDFQISNKNEGDLISDPRMTILVNNKLGIARITSFYTDNLYVAMLYGVNLNDYLGANVIFGGENGIYQVDFDCTENSEETKVEEEYNNYLNKWLKDYIEAIREDKNYFKKKEIQ